jgi:hypothetical protein
MSPVEGYGRPGDDVVVGHLVRGGPGNDVVGGADADGEEGDDEVQGHAGDVGHGGPGNDVLEEYLPYSFGPAERAHLYGDAGDDRLVATAG